MRLIGLGKFKNSPHRVLNPQPCPIQKKINFKTSIKPEGREGVG
jgi:hypothetical protein